METIQTSPATRESLIKFLFFWGGQEISLLGSFIAQFVIIWWITITYQSAFYLSLASVLGFGSILISSVIAGVYIDRYDRKKIILFSDTLQALLSFLMIYLFATNSMELSTLLILLVFRGIFQGIQQPAVWAIVPVMVPKHLLRQVNALNYFFTGTIVLVGPLIAAFLLSIFGLENIDTILWVDIITYLISFVPLILMSVPSVRKGPTKPYITEFKEGVNFIRQTKGLIVLMSIFPFANFFLTPFITLLPLLIIDPDIFNGNEVTLASALALQQVAFIIGSFIMTKFSLFKRNTSGIACGLYLWIIGVLIAIAGGYLQSVLLLYIGLFISGFTVPITNISSQTIWQTVVPLDLQGRVNVVRRLFGEGSTPLGLLFVGILAELMDPLLLILILVLIELVILTYTYMFTSFKDIETIISDN